MSRIFFVVFAAALMVGVVFLSRNVFNGDTARVSSVGKIDIGGPFNLIDQNGKAVTDQDFKGKYMLIYFGYTFCPDVCPTTLSTMGDALNMLTPEQMAKVVPIFITIDPERDTPELLASYVHNFHEKMLGLTGPLAEIKKVAKAYKVYFGKANEDDPDGNYTMDHGSTTYFMGPDGTYAAHFSHGISSQIMAKKMAEFL